MDEKELEQLKEYMSPASWYLPSGIALILVGILLLCGLHSYYYSVIRGIVGGISGIVLGGALIYVHIISRKEFPEKFKELEKSGVIPILLSDFKTGLRPFGEKSKFILGNNYIIRKNETDIIKYSDITSVLQDTERNNSKEVALCILLKNKKTVELVRYKLNDENSNRASQAVNHILSMNPEI